MTRKNSTFTLRAAAVIVGAAALVAAGCGSDDDTTIEAGAASAESGNTCAEIALDNGFVRLPPAENTAAYVDITNTSGSTVTLVSAATDLGQMVELHETGMNDEGVMSMAEVPGGIEIADGETVSLEPGGLHVMIMGVTRDVTDGEMVDVDFAFDNGCSTTLALPVQVVEGMTMNHDDMDHSDMDMDGESDE